MAVTKNAQEIQRLLDRHFFDQVLGTSRDGLPAYQRETADEVVAELKTIRDRIHGAGSAEEMVRLFHETTAHQGQSLDARLKSLALPTISEMRYHVDKLAAELGLQRQA